MVEQDWNGLQSPLTQGDRMLPELNWHAIAHQIFCELGNCGDDPLCFNGRPESEQAQWVEAVKKVVGFHCEAAWNRRATLRAGGVWVPVEPTEAMLYAGADAIEAASIDPASTGTMMMEAAKAAYAAMLAAVDSPGNNNNDN